MRRWSRSLGQALVLAVTLASCVRGVGGESASSRRGDPIAGDVARVASFLMSLPTCKLQGDDVDIGEALTEPFSPSKVRLRGWLKLGSGACTALACVRVAVDEYGIERAPEGPSCCNGCGGFWVLGSGAGEPDPDASVALLADNGSAMSWGGMDCSLDAMRATGPIDVVATGVLRPLSQHWQGTKAEIAQVRLCVVSDAPGKVSPLGPESRSP